MKKNITDLTFQWVEELIAHTYCMEGAGGLLTDFESEESPLSTVQANDTSRDTEMGRSMVQKRYDTRCVR